MWLLYHLQLSSSSWIFSSAFSVFFLFAFQFEEFLLKYPQLHKFFLQPCPSIISPSKTFLMLQYFFISIISFFFSLEFPPVCLYFQFVLACCLFISVLNILIIVILNFQSDHLIISVSLLYLSLALMLACSLSSNYGFLLLAFWVHLLFIYFGYLGMLYWVKELQK